jgi:hypothetical protein
LIEIDLRIPGAKTMANRQRVFAMGHICHRLGQPFYRIAYAIRSRRIRPIAIAGHARLFDEDGIERIEAALQEMDAKRASVQADPETSQAATRQEERS